MKNKNRKIIDWLFEHIRFHAELDDPKKDYPMKDENSMSMLENIKKHSVVGIKFRWRF